MCVGGLRGILDLLLRVLPRRAIRDVVAHGVVKEDCFLAHDTSQRAQRRQLDLPRVDAVDQNPPTYRLIESRNQIDERALSRAARTYERNDLTLSRGKVDLAEHRGLGVRKVDAIESELALERRAVARTPVALELSRRIQDLEQALGGRQ